MATAVGPAPIAPVQAPPAAPVENSQARGGRVEYLDALKVVLIALVLAHHAGQPYGPTGGVWPVTDQHVRILGSFFAVNAAFFMGLFFFISAYFLPGSLDHKGVTTFLKERFVRLGTPIALLFVIGAVMVLASSPAQGAAPAGFLTRFYNLVFVDNHLTHLWFIWHLLVYAVLYVAWRTLTAGRGLKAPGPPSSLAILFFTLALGAVTFAVRIDYPIDRWAVLLGFIPAEVAHLPQYASFFVLGVMAARGQWFSRLPARTGWTWLAIGGVLGLARYFAGWDTGGLGPWALPSAEWEAFIATGLSVGLLVLFRECFAGPSRLIRWAAPSAYGVYVIQLFVLLPLQLALLPLNAPPLAKFFVVATLGILLSFLLVNQLRRIHGVAAVL